MGLSQWKVFISWVTILGVWDRRVALSLSQGEILSTKTMFWLDIVQLTRTVSQKWNYKTQNSRLAHLETSLELWALID